MDARVHSFYFACLLVVAVDFLQGGGHKCVHLMFGHGYCI